MADLLLDPAIRTWVFIPIVLINFFVGILRHYVHLLLSSKKKTDLDKVKDTHYLAKARLLRANGNLISRRDFEMRKNLFLDEKKGYLQTRMESKTTNQNPLDPAVMTEMLKGNMLNMVPMIVIGGWINWTFSGFVTTKVPFPLTLRFKPMLQRGNPLDPAVMTEMLKGNMLNMVPMIVIGGWINWTFSGFVTTKVPFPLTLRFKPMLQRGVNLLSLDAAWVSSASWYFLNVFGLRSIYGLVLGGENAAELSMDEQMMGVNPAVQNDPKQVFKAEWEALHISYHKFAL
uniref:ER membrane protein complex subunit 3 n=2 Tax=Panagrolaimus sp. JU765 TaxID=591449 RepID=A0AC34QWQ5_9BILA